MRIDQWVPALHRGRRHRRLRATDARRLPVVGPRRPTSTRSSWTRTSRVTAGRCRSGGAGGPDDVVILHYALPVAADGCAARAIAAAVCSSTTTSRRRSSSRGYDPEMVRICALGREELGSLREQVDLGPGRQRVQSPGAGGGGLSAHGRAAHLPRLRPLPRGARPRPPAHSRRRPDATCSSWDGSRPTSARRTSIRLASYWKRFICHGRRGSSSWASSRDERLLRRPAVPHVRAGLHARGGRVLPATWTTASCSPATGPRTSSSPQRARGLRRAARRGHEDARAHPGLRPRPRSPYTLGEAGLQLGEKRFDVLAEMAHRLATDDVLRAPCWPARIGGWPLSRAPRSRPRLRAYVESR